MADSKNTFPPKAALAFQLKINLIHRILDNTRREQKRKFTKELRAKERTCERSGRKIQTLENSENPDKNK